MEGLMVSRGLRKGAWTEEEDRLLRKCILAYGEGRWHQVPLRAGLNRCRKSCRMRWLNYLKPCIKRGEFKEDEVDLIVKLHRLLGNRWSMIAGRLPGRTANDIKNYWNTHLKSKKQQHKNKRTVEVKEKQSLDSENKTIVYKPRPRTFSKTSSWVWKSDDVSNVNGNNHSYTSMEIQNQIASLESINEDLMHDSKWWESLLFDKDDDVNDHETSVHTHWWESLLFNNDEANDHDKGTVDCHL